MNRDEKIKYIYETWNCGNRSHARTELRHQSKKFLIQLIQYMAMEEDYMTAVKTAYKMVIER